MARAHLLLLIASYLAVSAPALAQGEPPEEEEEIGELSTGRPVQIDVEQAVNTAIEARKTELAKSAYSFCNDEDFEPQSMLGEKRFCKAFDESSLEACPRARAMCEEKHNWWSDLRLALPEWLGWSIIAAAAAALLFALFRTMQTSGWGDRGDLADLGALLDEEGLIDLQALPEAPALAILRRARQSLDEDRVPEAAVLAQLAMLRFFEDTGLVQFHPSRTNGEYLRAIRSQPDLAALYRSIARETDRIRFGDGAADPESVRGAIDTAGELLQTPVQSETSGSAAALPLATIALAIFFGAGCESPGKPFYSHRPNGLAALPALLRAIGLNVEIARYEFQEIPEDAGVVVVRTGAPKKGGFDALRIDALLDRDLAVIVIDDSSDARHFLPITSTVTSSTAFLEVFATSPPVREVEVLDGTFCGVDFALLAELAEDGLKLPESSTYVWDGRTETATVSSHRLELQPLLDPIWDEDGSVEALAFGAARPSPTEEGVEPEPAYLPGCIMVFNVDLFTNASLASAANAGFVSGLFASLVRPGERVILLNTLDGGKQDESISRSIVESRMLPLIVHGGLWVALLFMLLGASFGPLRDPVVKHHKAFVEHVEAVGRHYAGAGLAGLTHAARSLARLVVIRHRHQVRGGSDGGWLAIARHLSEKHSLPEPDVRAALRLGIEGLSELGAPGPDDPSPASEKMLRTLSTLLTGKQRKQEAKRRRFFERKARR
jgi:hypothetical protein